MAEQKKWLEIPELGTVFGLRFVVLLCRLAGRTVTRGFIAILVFYYALLNPAARAGSRAYLRRIGEPHKFRDILRHFRHFGVAALDRLFFVQGKFEAYKISRNGHEILLRLKREKQGAILLGAHLGSFEVMRALGDEHGVAINVVGDFRNSERINRVLERVNPKANARMINVRPDDASFVFEISDCIERGELVAILGDRVGHGATTHANFLGDEAPFPTGPYVLASLLECPIYFTCSLFTPPNVYELYCEPFANTIKLPRRNREKAAAEFAQLYADRLEYYCRKQPYSWFNFHNFWQTN